MASNGARIFLTPHDPPGAEGALRLVVSWRPGRGSVLARASAVLTPEKQDAMQEHGPRGPTLSAATALPTSTLSPPPLRLSCSVFFQRQTHTSSPLQTFPGPRGEGMIFPPHLWVLPTLGHRTALIGEAPSAPSPAGFLPRAAGGPPVWVPRLSTVRGAEW